MTPHSRRGRGLLVWSGMLCWLALGGGHVGAEDPAAGDEPVEVIEQDEVLIEEEAMLIEEDVFVEEFPEVPMMAVPNPVGGDGLFGAGLRMLFDAIAPEPAAVPDAAGDENEPPADPAQPQAAQQRAQIRQHARQLEQMLQPALRTELDVIRRACGDLSPEARRTVLSAGRTALTKTALEVATLQMTGGDRRRAIEPRRRIADALAKALEPLATKEQFATYQREQRLRQERRGGAARVAIVAKLDRRLDLTAAQRAAIEADLEEHWEPSWVRELDDRGMMMNNERACPDYAAARIEPHLRPEQQAEWARWRKAAGSALFGMHAGWNLDSLGLHVEDEWWTK